MMLRQKIMCGLMVAASIFAYWAHPTVRVADQGEKLNLEKAIPTSFGQWQAQELPANLLVNPQQNELVKKIYAQVLSRTYINQNGTQIMLTIAYGEDQSDGMALHYPEVCYPAQGFQIRHKFNDDLKVMGAMIPVKRLVAYQGHRNEPITYWTTMGSKVVRGGTQAKLEQIKYGIHGLIPDGLLFRVSSINTDAAQAFDEQNEFITSLVQSMTIENKKRIAGL